MIRRRGEVVAAVTLCVAVALVGFRLLTGPLRDLEAAGVVLLDRLAAVRVGVVGDHLLQVLPAGSLPFRAQLTPFCSALVSLLALGTIAVFVLRGPLWRRLAAFAVAGSCVLAANMLRIAVSVWVGSRFGSPALVLFHDWVGTAFGLAYTMAGFLLMLYLLLPSATARIPRAARVSDVL